MNRRAFLSKFGIGVGIASVSKYLVVSATAECRQKMKELESNREIPIFDDFVMIFDEDVFRENELEKKIKFNCDRVVHFYAEFYRNFVGPHDKPYLIFVIHNSSVTVMRDTLQGFRKFKYVALVKTKHRINSHV